LTEPAAVAATDRACPQLRLPTVRGLVTDLAVVAGQGRWVTVHTLASHLLIA